MAKSCSHKKISLAYPKHWPAPEDLLTFIESTKFTADWSELGLDDEDDLTSLQLCLMTHPDGDEIVDGTHGLRLHRHFLHRNVGVQAVTAYYGYFPDYGVIYLNHLEAGRVRLNFNNQERAAIEQSLRKVEIELERLKTIRVRERSFKPEDGSPDNE